mgnify:FL=1|jgi:hypothetical protein|nr:MAG TPA: hypothetical protein [Caudoviricetes sp.]
MDDELYHFGVKGMKWGVRRYQNEDGSLTSLGKKRDKMLSDRKTAKKHSTTSNMVKAEYSRREFEDAKTRLKLENQKKKSKRQQDLEKKYIDQGFAKDEAEIKAYNRAKTETILKVAGGIALASAAAYVAYKHYDKVTDRVFEKGSEIGRLTNNGSEPTNRAFYGFVNKHDKDRYEGLYGKTLGANGPVYRKAMRAAGDINVASPESARKVLKNMFDTDKQSFDVFKKNIDAMASVVPPTTKQGKLWRKAKQELDSGKIGDNTYKAFNTTLVLHTKEQQPINDKFYSAMKKAGYGAIRDVNDKENSGYFAKNPLIVFDTDKINVEGFTKLGNDHIDSMFAKEQGKIAAHTLANQYGPIGAAFATSIGAMKLVKRSNETKFVENYRKRHPESTLSNNEILKMRDRTVYA